MIALFVLIVMAFLGTALVKIQISSSEGIAQEVLGSRALMAARSGMQAELQILFPLSPATGSCPSGSSAKVANYDFATPQGLQQCSAKVTCTNYVTHNGIAYYRLTSTGECGSGTLESNSQNIVKASRTVQIEARGL